MVLHSLELTNFRNHKHFQVEFSPLTVFVGPNGIGKTNILEAIHLISTGNSWRTKKAEDLINWHEEFSKIVCKIENSKIELIILKKNINSKAVKINGVKKKIFELLGILPAVLFTPESLNIINGPPVMRRKFLDLLLIQTDRNYALKLIELKKILKSRNALLEIAANDHKRIEELPFWDHKLAGTGSEVIKKRIEASNFLNKILNKCFSDITGDKKAKLVIKYCSTVKDIQKFPETLFTNRAKELAFRFSIYGPHRDDFRIILNGREAKPYLSRGETRSVVLALKRAEMEFLRLRLKKEPVLLLDDIFSELDETRRKNIGQLLKSEQMILNATDLKNLPESLIKRAKVIKL